MDAKQTRKHLQAEELRTEKDYRSILEGYKTNPEYREALRKVEEAKKNWLEQNKTTVEQKKEAFTSALQSLRDFDASQRQKQSDRESKVPEQVLTYFKKSKNLLNIDNCRNFQLVAWAKNANAFIVNCPGHTFFGGIGMARVYSRASYYVLRFYPDIPDADMFVLAHESGKNDAFDTKVNDQPVEWVKF